jgi:hypothetical protein
MIGTRVILILFLSSCLSNFSLALYCICSNTRGTVFYNSSRAFYECSRTTVIQYCKESITAPGDDRSNTIHTAVLEMLKAVRGAASKADKVLPPPICRKLESALTLI